MSVAPLLMESSNMVYNLPVRRIKRHFKRVMPCPISAQTRYEMRMADQATRLLRITESPIEKVMYSCLRRGAAGIVEFRNVFRTLFDDESTKLTLNQFTEALNQANVALTQEEIEDIFHQLDPLKSGKIDYTEFLKAIRPPINRNRTTMVNQAFDKIDQDKDGKISTEDIKSNYNVRNHPDYLNGYKTHDELFRDFMKIFPPNGQSEGMLSQEDFMDYYAGVSASIEDDMYFDLMMRKAWKL